MKALFTFLLINLICFFSIAQQSFQTTFPIFQGDAYGDIVFAQNDGQVVSGIGLKDKLYLFLIKTNHDGDTIWTKDIDLGLTSMSTCYGTTDQYGNLYIALNTKLTKFDQLGNLIWSTSISNTVQNLQYSDNNIWMSTSGVYLYKFDATTGDSIWRSNSFSESDSRSTSLTVDVVGNVLLSVSDKNGYSGWLYESELFYLSSYSDSVINIPFNTGVSFVIQDTKQINDFYYSIGREQTATGVPSPRKYLVKYNSNGDILDLIEINLNYSMSSLSKLVVNNDNQFVLLGAVRETNQSNDKILLHCCSIEGDSIWTTINGLGDLVIGLDLKLSSDGGYIISGACILDPYSIPYLLKTNPSGTVTKIGTPSFDQETIIIYPNPTTETVKLGTGNFIGGTLSVYSLENQLLIERLVDKRETIITVSQLTTGTYIYRIIKDKKIATGKFIII